MGHLAGDGREALQELIQSIVSLQIFEQRLYRNTGVLKDGPMVFLADLQRRRVDDEGDVRIAGCWFLAECRRSNR